LRAPFRVVVEPRLGGAAPLRIDSIDGLAIIEGVPVAWGEVLVRAMIGIDTVGVASARVLVNEDVPVLLGAVSPCQLRAIIVDESGALIDGVFATASPTDGVRVPERARQAETGADGLLVMQAIEPIPMQLAVIKNDYGRLHLSVDMSIGGDVDLGRIVLPRGRSVRGRVIGVSASDTLNARYPKLGVGAIAFPDSSAALAAARSITGRRQVRVAEDGRFELHGLQRGTHLVFAALAGAGGAWRGITVEVGDHDVEGVEVQLGDERALECSVATVAGAPLRSGDVMAMGMMLGWYTEAAVDERGVARLRVGEGPFLVGVCDSLDIRWLRACHGTSLQEELILPDGSLEIVGIDAAGAGDLVMSQVTVTYVAGQLDAAWLPLTMSSGRLQLDVSGHLLVRHLLPGEYRLAAR
jgi:hypothetical protein